MPEDTKLAWRENIHKALKFFNHEWEQGIPLAVIDAIDAAYVAGLDRATEIKDKRRTV